MAFEAICKRGHWVAAMREPGRGVDTDGAPLDRFCEQCGAGVLNGCGECGNGFRLAESISVTFTPPGFCRKCGSPQPWTTREARVQQLANLLEDEQLDAATMLAAKEAIAELAGVVAGDASDDSLAAQQVDASERLRKLAPGAWDFIQPVLQTLLLTAAKSQLGL